MSSRLFKALSDLLKSRRERELDEEVAFHLDMATDALTREGLDAARARRRARLEFGGVERVKQDAREVMRFHRLWSWARDLQSSVRSLWREPGFAAAMVATLALSASTIAIMLALLRQAMLMPLPYPESDRLLVVQETDAAHPGEAFDVSPGNYVEWAEQTAAFEHLGVAEPSGVDVVVGGRRQAFLSWNVNAALAAALRLEPVLGRTFRPEEFLSEGARVALIAHATWERVFGADPSLVGRTLDVDGAPVTIVGVLPAGIDFPAARDLWMPWELSPYHRDIRQGNWMVAAGRLVAGATAAQAEADVKRIAATLATRYPETNANAGVSVQPVRKHLLRGVDRALWALGLGAAFLWLAACATVTSLYLTRLRARASELAVRAALGATPRVLGRRIAAELAVLATIAVVVALLLVPGYLELLKASAPEQLPQVGRLHVDGFLVFSILLGLPLMVAASGIWPSLHVLSDSLLWSLRDNARVTLERQRVRTRNAFIVVQVAIATTLLIGAALMSSSLGALLDQELGFEADGIVSLQVFTDIDAPAARVAFFSEVMDELRARPGVRAAAATSALPFHPTQIDPRDNFQIVDRVTMQPEGDLVAHTLVATPGYFELLGVPLISGRTFNEFDRPGNTRVAVINRTMARRFWPDANPLGERVRIGIMSAPQEWEIVGVVGDIRPYGFDSPPREELYVPHAQAGVKGMTFVVATTRPEAMLPELQSFLGERWPEHAVHHAATLASLVAHSLATRTFAMVILAGFTVGAVALALLGIYGLVTYTIALRRREIGIRSTLGASPQRIRTTIVGHGLKLAALGTFIGIGCAALIAPSLRALLYAVEPLSPGVYLAAVATMLATAGAAAWVPAWRAARMRPADLLRG